MTLAEQIKAWREVVDRAAKGKWEESRCSYTTTFSMITVRKILDALEIAVKTLNSFAGADYDPVQYEHAEQALKQIEEKLK